MEKSSKGPGIRAVPGWLTKLAMHPGSSNSGTNTVGDQPVAPSLLKATARRF